MIIKRLKLSFKRFNDGRLYKSKIHTLTGGRDAELKSLYCSDAPFEERVRCLISYFVDSWVKSSSKDCTRAYFEGAFSYNDRDIDAIEGTTRFLPFIASVLVNKSYSSLKTTEAKSISLEQMFIDAIVNGTDPDAKGYWGEVEDYSQLICEGADVALAVWIAKDKIANRLTAEQKLNLYGWLYKCASKKIVDNNWHLFRQTILLVLSKLDKKECLDTSSYERTKSFYVGDGWFSDGVGNKFDFYNAWAFHYSLYWITQIDNELDNKFIIDANFHFCKAYQNLFTLNGFPLFGRSHCYRMAASSPLIISVLLKNNAVDIGRVKRIFDQLWRYFIANNGVANGVPTQGFLKRDLRFLDEYSGPGSSLWGLRSLILILQLESDNSFWQIPEKPLAIENGDYIEKVDSIGLKISGSKKDGTVNVEWLNREPLSTSIEPYRLIDRLKEFLSQRPQRPKNNAVKNKLRKYSSKYPFIEDK